MPRTRALTLLLAMALLGACEASTPSLPSATSSPMAEASPATTTAAPAATAQVPQAAAIVARWRQPAHGERLGTSEVRLEARVAAQAGPVDKVTFRAAWPGDETVLCAAKEEADSGLWSCTANLLARAVPIGLLHLTFDVRAGGELHRSPAGSRDVVHAAVPPKPADTSIALVRTSPVKGYEARETYRVRWAAPTGYAATFHLYRLDTCLRASTRANDAKGCVVPGMAVPTDELVPLATTQEPDRSMTFKRTVYVDGLGGPFGTILLRATSEYGDSTFAIVQTDRVCWRCTY